MDRIVGTGFKFEAMPGQQRQAAPAAAAPVAATKAQRRPQTYSGGGSNVRDGIVATAQSLGIDPVDLATAISYETGGTFDPTKAGPVTKWGRHRGLIQFGEPQAQKYGVDWNDPVGSQLGPDGAVAKYLREAGVRPGMGLLDVYSAINAGSVGKYSASDVAAGGAPGNVRDKVNTMGPHRAKAAALLGGAVDNIKTSSVTQGSGGAAAPSQRGRGSLERIVVNKDSQIEPDTIGDFGGIKSFDPMAAYRSRQPATSVPSTPDAFAKLNLDRESRGLKPLIQMPADKYEKWKKKFDEDQPGALADVWTSLKAGAYSTSGSILPELIRLAPGGDKIVDTIDSFESWLRGSDPSKGNQTEQHTEEIKSQLSARAKAAQQKEMISETKNPDGSVSYGFGEAWSDPYWYMTMGAESIPATVAMLVPGQLVAKAARAKTYATEFARLVGGGMEHKAAVEAATKLASIAGARKGAAVGMIGEALIGGAQGAAEARAELRKVPIETWRESEVFQALVKEGRSEDEAIKQLTEDATTQAYLISAVVDGTFGGTGDYVIAKIIGDKLTGGVGERIAKGLAKGAAAEAGEETAQSAGEQVGQNVAMRTVEPDRPLTQGVANAAVSGGVLGGILGGGIGAGVGAASPAETAPSPPPTDEDGTAGTGAGAGGGGPPAGGVPGGANGEPATAQEAGQQAAAGQLVGPLQRAMGHGEQQAKDVVNQAATAAGAPAVGSQVTVDYGEGSSFTGTIDGYAATGEAHIVDEDGEVHEVPPEFVRPVMPSGTQDIELAPDEFGPAQEAQAAPARSPGAAEPAGPQQAPRPPAGEAVPTATPTTETPPPAAPSSAAGEAAAAQPAAKPEAAAAVQESAKAAGTATPVFHTANRIITMVDIDGVKVPFYISTGAGGKEKVAKGKWYPFFGMGKDDGWFNKGSQDQINAYYNNPKLRAAAEHLDATLGDLQSQIKNIPAGYSFAAHPDWLDKFFGGNAVDTTGMFDHLPNANNKEADTATRIGEFINKLSAVPPKSAGKAAKPAVKEPAGAKHPAPAAPTDIGQWWDNELTAEGRKRVVARMVGAKKTSTHALWKNLDAGQKSAIVSVLQAMYREGTLPAGRPPAEVKEKPAEKFDASKTALAEKMKPSGTEGAKPAAPSIPPSTDKAEKADKSADNKKPTQKAKTPAPKTAEVFDPDKNFAENRAALGNFKKGDKVEWTHGDFYREPVDGSKDRIFTGTVVGVSDKQQGVIEVKGDTGGDWYVQARRLRPRAAPAPAPAVDVAAQIKHAIQLERQARDNDRLIAAIDQGGAPPKGLSGQPMDRDYLVQAAADWRTAAAEAIDKIPAAQRQAAKIEVAEALKPKARKRVIARDSSPDTTNPKYTDHGIDITLENGDAAKALTLERHGKNGHENMVILDVNGDVVANGEGKESTVPITLRNWDMMVDPDESLVVHHNHPDLASLSEPDLAMATMPGVKSLYAHVPGGKVSYRVEVLPAARARLLVRLKLDRAHASDSFAVVLAVFDTLSKPLVKPMTQAVVDGHFTVDQANDEFHHLFNSALHDGGWIIYDASGRDRISPMLAIPSIKAAYDEIVARTRKQGGSTGNGRPAEPIRHPGEITGIQGRGGEAAAKPAADSTAKAGPGPAAQPAAPAKPTQQKVSSAKQAQADAVAELEAMAAAAEKAGRKEKPWRAAMREAMRKSSYAIRPDGTGSGVQFEKGWVDGVRGRDIPDSANDARRIGESAGKKWVENNPVRTDTVTWKLGGTTYNIGNDAETLREFAGRIGKLPLAHFQEKTGPRLKAVDKLAWQRWFRKSKVVDDKGNPLAVYRGEHGPPSDDFQTRLPSLSFGSAAAANVYAKMSNTYGEKTHASRVTPVHLRIENPILDNRDDPFVDFKDIAKKLGREVAEKLARKHASHIENTNNWEEHFAFMGGGTVDGLLNIYPQKLDDLYMDAYPLLDDPEFVAAAKAAGYDGAIHIGNGETFDDVEYRIFDARQAKSVHNPYPSDDAHILRSVKKFESSVQKDGDSPVRISTRYPDLVSSTEDPIVERLTVGVDSMKAEPNKGAFAHNMRLVASYLNMPRGMANRQPDFVARRFKAHVKANLRWLYDQVPAAQRQRTKLWYDGARAITDRWMAKYKQPDHVIAGVLAALSPQKDWYQNVSLAERVLDIVTLTNDKVWTNAMGETAHRIFAGDDKASMLNRIRGKTLDQVAEQYADDPHNYRLQAMWVRVYDETYHDPRHRQISSEGDFVGEAVDKVGWGTLAEIAKAVAVIRDPDYANVSRRMGYKHKVRNFFNNILAPNAPHGDITIDTHAVAAALLRALSGSSAEVHHNFGTSPDRADQPRGWRAARSVGISGTSGIYGLYADAYRELAAELGILPRELQSITWEAVRGLFTNTFKSQARNVAAIDAVWRRVRNGEISADAARSEILRVAGGINAPSWYGPDSGITGGAQESTYSRELPEGGLRQPDTEAVDGGTGGGAAADISEPRLEARSIRDLLRSVGSTLTNPSQLHAKDWIQSQKTRLTPAGLGAIYLNYLPDLAPRAIKGHVEDYIKEKRDMDTFRTVIHQMADKTVEEWRKYTKLGKDKVRDLHLLMHDATIAGIDPADTDPLTAAKPGYAALRTRYMAMPQAGRDLYVKVRDEYQKINDDTDRLLIAQAVNLHDIADRKRARDLTRKLRDIDLNATLSQAEKDQQKQDARDAAAHARTLALGRRRYSVNQLRRKLERNKIAAPYFPLGRFGKYYVEVRDQSGKLEHFELAETQYVSKQNEKRIRAAYPAGFDVRSGLMAERTPDQNVVGKPSFITEIETLIPNGPDKASIMDQLWQRYLRTAMPDMSVRSKKLHRKAIEGYSEDALRVYANHMFHAGHQMAKLKHGLKLADLVEETRLGAQETSQDQELATQIGDELAKRHEWVMNPKGSNVAQWATRASFLWYLGASPAAAMVNIAQTPMIGIPLMGARFGSMTKAASEIARASKNPFSDAGLSVDEKRAMQDMEKTGLIDATQSLDIQGVAEEGLAYNPRTAWVMQKIGWMFHKAEVANRRITALAAYRLSRAEGRDHDHAVKTATDLTWRTHFDYSNSSRPRHVQSAFGRIALSMRSYQMNMLYLLGRSFHQAFKGENAQVKKEARYQIAGILGMQALVAGGTGVAGYNTVFFLYGIMSTMWSAIFGGGDDEDDPFTAQQRFKETVLEMFGPYLGKVLLEGPIGATLNIDLTSRVGMPDLWFKSPLQDIESGKDAYAFLLESVAGAPPAIVGGFLKAYYDQFSQGNIQRGIETASPKMIKDMLKTWRYATEGLTQSDGDVVLANVGWWAVISQSMGFTPANVAEQWDKVTALKGAEQRIKANRQAYINSYAMAVKSGDDDGRADALEKIRNFNKSQYGRTMPIKGSTLTSSLKHRAVAESKRERGGGVYISNEALRRQLQLGLPATAQ